MAEVPSEPFSIRWNSQTQDEHMRRVACFQCRRRKVKCDKRKPSCQTCIQNHQDCKYPVEVARPGPKLGTKYNHDGKSRTIRRTSQALTTVLDPKEDRRMPGSSATEECESIHVQQEISSEASSEQVHIAPSWILHNFHETQSYQISEHAMLTPSTSPASSHIPRTIQSSNADYICQVLGIAQSTAEQLQVGVTSECCLEKSDHSLSIDLYFENMTAVTLLRRTTFYTYLYTAMTSKHSAALAAAMFSFSARFAPPSHRTSGIETSTGQSADQLARAGFFFKKASDLTKDCLDELRDDLPPLALLQALTITTSYEMVHAAKGKAWRALGTCIRLAHELRLHQIDVMANQSGRESSVRENETWVMNEERRRLWWALWELDVFMSSVNMMPISIGDAHNATLLPVEDEAWFDGRPRESSFLEVDPVKRWKQLQQSGNQSGKAWYILINSFTRDIHCLSHPTRPLDRLETDQGGHKKLTTKLNTLANCVSCFALALPDDLAYERFPPAENIDWGSRRRMSEKHVIHLMFQLTKLYIYHHECFNKDAQCRSSEEITGQNLASPSLSFCSSGGSSTTLQHTKAWRDYVEMSEEISQVIRNSHIDHIRYGHPLLVNVYWMIAAIQLLRQKFATSEEERQLAQSNFDLLKLTLVRNQKFWNSSPTLLANLVVLSHRLDPLSNRSHRSFSSSEHMVEGQSNERDSLIQLPQTNSENDQCAENCQVEQPRALIVDPDTPISARMASENSFGHMEQNFQGLNGPHSTEDYSMPMDDSGSRLYGDVPMDSSEIQAYMESILFNRWNDWPGSLDFEGMG